MLNVNALKIYSCMFCFNLSRFGFQEVPEFTSQFVSTSLLESKPLNGLRIGLIRETIEDGVDTGVASAIRGAASHLEELGCSVSEVYIHYYPLWFITSLNTSVYLCLPTSFIYLD